MQGELIGLAIAQKRFNDAAEGKDLRLRVLIANAGAKFQYAVPVARQIRKLALKDRTIVAVVGFEQSPRQTNEAIKLLAKSALPLVGTANSYDGTALLDGDAGYSPYYFRLASPNKRTAEHAAYWARHGDVNGKKVDDAVVIYDGDPDDLYSRNLATDFEKAFRPGKALMRPYKNPGELNKAVREACQDQPDMFYYAGRSDEFRSFINVLELSCPKRPLVMADDEIAKYVSDNADEIGRKNTFDLYFTPLAARGVDVALDRRPGPADVLLRLRPGRPRDDGRGRRAGPAAVHHPRRRRLRRGDPHRDRGEQGLLAGERAAVGGVGVRGAERPGPRRPAERGERRHPLQLPQHRPPGPGQAGHAGDDQARRDHRGPPGLRPPHRQRPGQASCPPGDGEPRAAAQ